MFAEGKGPLVLTPSLSTTMIPCMTLDDRVVIILGRRLRAKTVRLAFSDPFLGETRGCLPSGYHTLLQFFSRNIICGCGLTSKAAQFL